jgi:oligoendopeptidase, pepF/M3 family
MAYIDTWDLDAIYPGRSRSPELKKKLEAIREEIEEYGRLINCRDGEVPLNPSRLQSVLKKQEEIEKGLEQARSFTQMCQDAFMDDQHANVMMGKIIQLKAKLEKWETVLMKKIASIPDSDWNQLLSAEPFASIQFPLNEIRDKGKRLLSEKEESIITELNKDGLTAWSRLYDTAVSIMTIPFSERDGKTIQFSVGQAMNRMYSDPDPAVRKQLFENWEAAWGNMAPIFADTLNHLAGFRLTVQNLHGRSHFLEEPLEYNRMSKETLDAMWQAVAENKKPFIGFLKKKAQLLGMEKLGWQDVEAPVAVGEEKPIRFTYDEACEFVINHFATFGPKMASFAKHALENRWVEAEDRPNKRPGGYCTDLPELGESRIFMTFTGSSSGVATLAHELGHAFHTYCMRDLPELSRRYAMNVAETASTFAETIVADATVRRAKTREEKLTLLNDKLGNAVAMFMNIHARFLFETAFYEERRKGIVPVDRLNELMLEAQREAYGDILSTYHPHFWCSKLHFFIDDVPFYNFPYTFGYLFSLGIFAEFQKQPDGFEQRYIALLRDTGRMKVEDLAKKHLGVDLTRKEFWEAGIRLCAEDAEEFIRLADEIR